MASHRPCLLLAGLFRIASTGKTGGAFSTHTGAWRGCAGEIYRNAAHLFLPEKASNVTGIAWPQLWYLFNGPVNPQSIWESFRASGSCRLWAISQPGNHAQISLSKVGGRGSHPKLSISLHRASTKGGSATSQVGSSLPSSLTNTLTRQLSNSLTH